MSSSFENSFIDNEIKNDYNNLSQDIKENTFNDNHINYKINQSHDQINNNQINISPETYSDNEKKIYSNNINEIITKKMILMDKSNDGFNNKVNIERSKTEKKNNEIIINKIKYISNIEDEKNTDMDSIKLNEFNEQINLRSNKEYNDNDSDIISKRITPRNNTEQYLLMKEDKNIINLNNINNINNINNYNENNIENNLFPFRIIGDVKKKSKLFGKYNSRYIELDAVKGLFKRYKSSKEYPKRPKEIIDINNIKFVKKVKRIRDFYDLEITYRKKNKKGEIKDKILNFRLRHVTCRNKWFDALYTIWSYLIKGTPVPKITKDFLWFIDDRIGIEQEIGKHNKKEKDEKSEINVKKFKILSLLGVGGFGTVFKVKNILTDKIYAMKVMNKNYIIKRKYLHYVVSEFEIMKTLAGFPFILDLHYVFQSANYLYMIFDYCPNGDFTNLAKIHNLKLFLAEIILAFEYIHSHNIVYRDLKPENILLDETGHIRVCDFNLAKAGITKDMRANSLCGSPMYFSPELLLKKGVDYKTDIYGMGLLLYEIVTGTPAYNAPNTKVLYELIKNNTIDFDVPGLIGDIKDLIEKMLVKEPNERITLDEMKKHNFLKDIDFDKVLRKEYGTIEIQKNGEMIEKISKINEESKEKMEYEKFKLLQKKMDENKEYTVLDGKITVKEMFLDQRRVMKNFVKDFYYVKQEDIEQTKDFQIQVSSKFDFSSVIIDQYEFDP